jgi:hypothetical protein
MQNYFRTSWYSFIDRIITAESNRCYLIWSSNQWLQYAVRLGCHAVALGKYLPTFWRTIMPSSSFVNCLTLKIKALQYFKTAVSIYPTTHYWIIESSVTQFSEPRILLGNKFNIPFIVFWCLTLRFYLTGVNFFIWCLQCTFTSLVSNIQTFYMCYISVGHQRLFTVTAVRKTGKSKSTSSVN